MSDPDLTEAIEAGRAAAGETYRERTSLEIAAGTPVGDRGHYVHAYAEAAVRAAAPIIAAAEREAIVARIEAAVVTGAVVPEWARAGGKPTAAGIRRWVIGIVRGEAK